jgi:hypothetical protein
VENDICSGLNNICLLGQQDLHLPDRPCVRRHQKRRIYEFGDVRDSIRRLLYSMELFTLDQRLLRALHV